MSEQRHRHVFPPPTYPPGYFVEVRFSPEPHDRNARVELRTSPDETEPRMSRPVFVPAGYEQSRTSFPYEEMRKAGLSDDDCYGQLITDFVWETA